jgi:tRNA-2-methylthio-N6-dimethylallyladenosine synthase
MPHFHLPVQHGADTVLERMRRRYTVAEYEERIARLFAASPDVALTSDIICGFPGETEEEHAQTLALLERIPYDNLFSFVFSERPHTAAALRLAKERETERPSLQWAEVPRRVATRRLEEVQRLQQARTLARHRSRIGHLVEVLVESTRTPPGIPGERFGRSRENWTVHFIGTASAGDIVRVRVERASLVAVIGSEIAVVDPTAHSVSSSRTRLAVLSA